MWHRTIAFKFAVSNLTNMAPKGEYVATEELLLLSIAVFLHTYINCYGGLAVEGWTLGHGFDSSPGAAA